MISLAGIRLCIIFKHRRRSSWTSGGGTHGERRRWVRVEWGGIWGGVSPLQPTEGSGGASWAPPAGSGAYFEGHRTLIFVPYIWQNLGGQFVLASPRSKFWGDLFPLSLPWSTPMYLRPRHTGWRDARRDGSDGWRGTDGHQVGLCGAGAVSSAHRVRPSSRAVESACMSQPYNQSINQSIVDLYSA